MKKLTLLIMAFFTVSTIFIYSNKLYYPSLPIDSISPKEAIQTINASNHDLVELSKDRNATWYITKFSVVGIQQVDDNIKQLIGNNGWEYIEKEGSGLFFEKNGERLIVTTEMWTKQYVLVKVPIQFQS
ncbi:hypothetical protein [Lysinibacillus cavernae]|uniref:hypothetical protein n=1 Tax=Lysinibacillus cavernae TaxID=2666135 RepID=UPI0012D87F86|nr:hypothetical protein [Lysinibacillus cavernae]